MYSKSKRFIASFLAVLMAVCMLPVDMFGAVGVVHAEEGDIIATLTVIGEDNQPVQEDGADLTTTKVTYEIPYGNTGLLELEVEGGGEVYYLDNNDATAYAAVEPNNTVAMNGSAPEKGNKYDATAIQILEATTLKAFTISEGTDEESNPVYTYNKVVELKYTIASKPADEAVDLEASMITVDDKNLTAGEDGVYTFDYSAKYVENMSLPAVAVSKGVKGTDYTVTYAPEAITAAGDYTITVAPIAGDVFKEGSSIVIKFTVSPADGGNDEPVDLAASMIKVGGKDVTAAADGGYTVEYTTAYAGTDIDLPAVTLTKGQEDTDYTVVFKKGEETVNKITAAGDYTVTVAVKSGSTLFNENGSIVIKFTVNAGTVTPPTPTTSELGVHTLSIENRAEKEDGSKITGDIEDGAALDDAGYFRASAGMGTTKEKINNVETGKQTFNGWKKVAVRKTPGVSNESKDTLYGYGTDEDVFGLTGGGLSAVRPFEEGSSETGTSKYLDLTKILSYGPAIKFSSAAKQVKAVVEFSPKNGAKYVQIGTVLEAGELKDVTDGNKNTNGAGTNTKTYKNENGADVAIAYDGLIEATVGSNGTPQKVYTQTITFNKPGDKAAYDYYIGFNSSGGVIKSVVVSEAITVTPVISGDIPDGADVYFKAGNDLVKVEKTEDGSSFKDINLFMGTEYTLQLRDSSAKVDGYTVTIDGKSTYNPAAADDGKNVTIKVAPEGSGDDPTPADEVAFTKAPEFTSTGDLATPHVGDVLTLDYTVNDKADDTKTEINWYRMDGTKKTTLDDNKDKKTYTITKDDVDGIIKADVTITNTAGDSSKTETAATGKVTLVKVAAPKAYNEAGTVEIPSGRQLVTGTKIALRSTDADAKIYYTTDGKNPTKASTEYTAPIEVTENVTITAVAVKEDMADSDIVKFEYTVVAADAVLAPYADPAAGTYDATQTVTLKSDTEGAEIYYTLDEKDPATSIAEGDTSTKKYETPLTIDKDTTIKAIAVKGDKSSSVATLKFSITAKKPEATGYVEGKVVESGTKVELTSATEGAKIYYAQGSSEADAKMALGKNKTEYSASSQPEITEGKTVIAAYAQKEGASKSEIVIFVYQLKLNKPTPSVPAGEVGKGTYVMLKADAGAEIIYKTAASAAEIGAAKETTYKNAIRIDTDTYIQAYAQKGSAKSETFEGMYTVKVVAGKPVLNSDGLAVELADPTEEHVYTGKAITPAVIVTNNSEPLIEGVDYTVKYSNNIKVTGTKRAKVTVTGKGNLSGSAFTEFDITAKDIADADVVVPDVTVQKNKTAALVLSYNGVKLAAKDYKVKEVTGATSPAANPAKTKWDADGTMTIEGQNNFKGETTIDVKVVDKLKKIKVVVDTKAAKNLVYNGEDKTDDIKKLVTVSPADKKDTTELNEYSDYMISWPANTTSAGAVKFTVVGCGEYTGLVAKSVTIKPYKNTETPISITGGPWADNCPPYSFVSTGVTFNDELTVSDGANELVEGRDYKVAYSNNKKVSEKAKVTVSFLGNYKGNKAQSKNFTIKQIEGSAAAEDIKVEFGNTKPWTKPAAYKAPVYLSIDGAALKNSDFVIKYYTDAARQNEMKGANKVELVNDTADYGVVYVTITGKGGKANFKDDVKIETSYNVYKLTETRTIDLSKAKVEIWDGANTTKKVSKLPYSGNEIELEKADANTTMVKGTYYVKVKVGADYVATADYDVQLTNNKNKGKATVIITPSDSNKAAGCKTGAFTIAANNLKLLDLFKNNKKSDS